MQKCKPKKLLDEVKRDFANALSSKECSNVLERMKNQCFAGCSADLKSLLSVAGEPVIDLYYKDSNTGKEIILNSITESFNLTCEVFAKRTVNLKIECR